MKSLLGYKQLVYLLALISIIFQLIVVCYSFNKGFEFTDEGFNLLFTFFKSRTDNNPIYLYLYFKKPLLLTLIYFLLEPIGYLG